MVNKYSDLTRNIYQKVVLNDTTTLIDELIHCTVSTTGSSDKGLTVGEFCSNSCKIVYKGNELPWKNGYFELISIMPDNDELIVNKFKVGNDALMSVKEISLGKYWVTNVEYDGFRYTVTGYDLPLVMFEEYDGGAMNSVAMVKYILNKAGLEANGEWGSFEINEIPDRATNMEMLGYIAGYAGNNVRVNRDGSLSTYWYVNRGFRIVRSMQYELGLTQDTKTIIINSVTCGTYKAGTGYGITINNPYIRQAQVNKIYNKVKGLTYVKADVKYRGNPAIEIGDIVRVETTTSTYVNVLVMAQDFNCDGGMNAVIHSYDNEEEKALVQVSPVERKISNAKAEATTYAQKLMNNIAGAGSGYYQLIDSDGNVVNENSIPAGWQISNMAKIVRNTKGWRFILGGLYHSSDGFQSFDTFALDADGNINASAIKVGEIDASEVNIKNLNANNITSGSIDANNIRLKNLNASNITTGTMSANRIKGGTIDASDINLINLNADNIKSGTLSANRIKGGTIDANDVTIKNINANNITGGKISADFIEGGTLTLGGESGTFGELVVLDNSNRTHIAIGYYGIMANRTPLSISGGMYVSGFSQFINDVQIDGNLTVNETLTVNGKITGIGNTYSTSQSSAISVPSGTWTRIASLTLPHGVYQVNVMCAFANNSTGYRQVRVSTSTSASAAAYSRMAGTAVDGNTTGSTALKWVQCSFIFSSTVQGNQTLYLNVYQNSGSALNVNNGMIEAVKISNVAPLG